MNFIAHDEFEHTFKYVEIAIGGKMATVTVTLTESQALQITDVQVREQFKKKIVEFLAAYMLENNLVEITTHLDKINYKKKVNVRCYLAPNDQIKILRMHYAKSI